MKNLNRYLKEKNSWRAIFNDAPLTLPADAQAIYEMLDCDMSPENICMDGEASPAFVRKQYQYLHSVMKELEDNYKIF